MLQPGEQVGPFVVERTLGAGAMGAVYRGSYPKTGQKVAIKIMLPGAAENKTTADRFRREIDILKQFAHPNIVRIVGDGKHHGQRYYAMEYIQGESLDHALARKGKLSWGEVVELGRQLCSALEHAHAKGVVHRDIKPSNLMILPDGTLKLTDFGIAKDLDVTQLTEANCTVGTASYMSPEQCRGERDITHKSDLYSLGIVFYELLTGRKPFHAENVMDMFMAHVKGTFERPSRVVDIPKWLDVLVVQLLEKKPEQRPRDAAKVNEALAEVLEKVESGQSIGVEVARSRRPGEKRDEFDLEAARALTGKKKKKKKSAKGAWYTQTWVRAVGLLLPLLAVVFIIWLLLRPPSAEALYGKIKSRMESGDPKQMESAHRGPMQDYLRRFRGRDDEMTKQVLAWDEQVGMMLAEESLHKTAERTKTVSLEKMDALSEPERRAVKAVLAENDGDLTEAKKLWKSLIDEFGDRGTVWTKLAQQRQSKFDAIETLIKELNEELRQLAFFSKEPQIDNEIKSKAFTAWRFEELGDLYEARSRWEALKNDLAGKPEQRAWFLLAASQMKKIGKSPSDDRLTVARKKLKEAETLRDASKLTEAEVLCLHLMALYKDVPPRTEFDPIVKQAKELFDDIQKKRGDKPK